MHVRRLNGRKVRRDDEDGPRQFEAIRDQRAVPPPTVSRSVCENSRVIAPAKKL
jgi:hypothetical protein